MLAEYAAADEAGELTVEERARAEALYQDYLAAWNEYQRMRGV